MNYKIEIFYFFPRIMEIKKGFSTKINEQFSLHIAENNDKKEFQQILELNVKVHGEPVREYLKRIYLDHPKKEITITQILLSI